MDRCFCPGFELGRPCLLIGDEARHLARVRRVEVGAEVEVFDGQGRAAVATVVAIGRDRVDLAPGRFVTDPAVARVRLTLATAIPKGDRFDWLIEKVTELGVERVVPLVTERSTVDPRSAKLDRVRRAVVEACKQSRRNDLMTIDDPIRWDRWLDHLDPAIAHRRVAHPGGTPWHDAGAPQAGELVVAAVGPEGGFTGRELEQAREQGFKSVALTPTVLRIETAALTVAAGLLL